MADFIEQNDRAVRFIYGTPEWVEGELAALAETYACTNLFYYVVEGELRVAATLLHQREIRKAALAQSPANPIFKLRPN